MLIPIATPCLAVALAALAQWVRAQQATGTLPAHLHQELLQQLHALQARANVQQQQQQNARRGGGGALQPRQFQLRVQVNVRMLLQLVVLLVLVYQHCPPRRFFMLIILGLALYLTATERARRLMNRLVGLRPVQPVALAAAPPNAVPEGVPPEGPPAPAVGEAQPPAQQRNFAENAQGAAAPAVAGVPVPEAVQGGGIAMPALLQELRALVIGFLTSLLPGTPLVQALCHTSASVNNGLLVCRLRCFHLVVQSFACICQHLLSARFYRMERPP
jgi:hypothetical protein